MTAPAIVSRTPAYDATIGARQSSAGRVASIDFVRGVVMVLMAIDHVRVYAGVPAGGPAPGVFFTRWITHFVAPGFAFLAGTAVFLHGRKLADRNVLAKFLLTRGAWLVLLELTVLRLAWTFNLDFAHYMLAGVIWMLGWCMILMAAAVCLPTRVIGGIGVGIVLLHNVMDAFTGSLWERWGDAGPNWALKFLYFGGAVNLGGDGGPPLLILYVLVPWIAVMMAGYAFGAIMEMDRERRRAIALKLGLAVTLFFVVLRFVNVYGDPRPWDASRGPAVLAFLNTTKYPASLAFLAMTLGPLLVLLALAERWKGKWFEVMATFGRVPMFYYLLHIPLIHAAAVLVSLVREGHVNAWLFGNHPMAPPEVPPGYRWSLGLLYMVWLACVAALYFPCQWYARVKAERRSKWLSYL